MKHIEPAHLPVMRPVHEPPKKPERTQLGKTALAGEEKPPGDAAAVGSATDGNSRRHRHRPPPTAMPTPTAVPDPVKPVLSAAPVVSSPALDLSGDAMKVLLALQEEDTDQDG